VAVTTDDVNTLEYRLSKLAGEGLCKTLVNINSDKKIVVKRLPRLASDQTATIQGGENANTIEIVHGILQDMMIN